MQDQADMWVHESFANYSENLFVECGAGESAGAQYVIGTRTNVANDRPIIGAYGVNNEGSGDMYYKGGNMLHTIRQVIGDDDKWREILRGLGHTFWHRTVTTQEIEGYISTQAGIDLSKIFDQYLRTTNLPVLEYSFASDTVLLYRWTDVVKGFDMPVKVTVSDNTYALVHPTGNWKRQVVHLSSPDAFKVDDNYYVLPSRLPLRPAMKTAAGSGGGTR
jgi:aminopeptidase N